MMGAKCTKYRSCGNLWKRLRDDVDPGGKDLRHGRSDTRIYATMIDDKLVRAAGGMWGGKLRQECGMYGEEQLG